MGPDTAELVQRLAPGTTFVEPDEVRELADGAELSLAGVEFTALHAPGHTPGSTMFRTAYPPDPDVTAVVFSGDVLFAGSIGRTDLPGGDHAEMLREPADQGAAAAGRRRGAARARPADHDRPGARNESLPAQPRGSRPREPSPKPLSGFPELLPEGRIVEQYVLDRLRRTFELHGFTPIETRAVEPLDRLAKQGEVDKEVYAVQRLHAEPGAAAELGLHFDLTVPFARYVLENAHRLAFPFRRYQIQKVWRGERPQEGRYREFTQADVDIIDADRLAAHHDVELPLVTLEALERLHVDLGVPRY